MEDRFSPKQIQRRRRQKVRGNIQDINGFRIVKKSVSKNLHHFI
jgi:hypothetical protein